MADSSVRSEGETRSGWEDAPLSVRVGVPGEACPAAVALGRVSEFCAALSLREAKVECET